MTISQIIQKPIVVFIFVTLLFSCKQQSGAKIGFMFPHTNGARMAIEEKFFKAKASELGCEVIFTDAKNDEQLQRDQARELLKQSVDILVLMAVNAAAGAEIVREAHKVGIKVIAYDRVINNCDLDFYISYNSYNVGKYMAQYAIGKKPEGKYFLLEGDKSDRNAQIVRKGHYDVIQSAVQSGKIKIVYDVFVEGWDGENATQIMKNYINLSSHDYPDVILCANDRMAKAMSKIFTEYNVSQNIIITGQDADPQSLRNIVKGIQSMTISKPLKTLAENAAIIAVKLIKNEKVESTSMINNLRIDVPSILFDPEAVDKENMQQTIFAKGIAKESDIFK
jgi:D-xylose transport system substrate-binding protein